MINILFVVPYYDMQVLAQEVINEYSCSDELHVDFLVANYLQIEKGIPNKNYDAIIARGLSGVVMKELSDQKTVIEMDFSGVEVLNALIQCKEEFNSKKVAIVGSPRLSYTGNLISKVSGVPIEIFVLDRSISDISILIKHALESGCDTIIGGAVTYNACIKKNINTLRINANKETLWTAINSAVRNVFIKQQERKELEILNSVVDNSKEGFILINNSQKICVFNYFAAKIMEGTTEEYLGKGYEVLPHELHYPIKMALKKQKCSNTEVFTIHNSKYSVSITPIMIDPYTNSVLLNFNDITIIQKMEEKIRNTLYAKGMVTKYSFESFIYKSQSMHYTLDIAKKFSLIESNIVIEGETGTGKEILAQSIHAYSQRKGNPFVAVNCATFPENLLESELFGYVSGAFTGASNKGKPGLFELAHNGTLFLDEVSEIPISFQGKLLRVLQEQEIRRVGGDKIIPVNVRIIAATNRNLLKMTEQNLFRRDLYFRLEILTISIPPLRQRLDDIYPLFCYFQDIYSRKFNKTNYGVSSEAIELLKNYPWPGNVRELKNIVERLIAVNDNEKIESAHILRVFPEPFFKKSKEDKCDENKEKVKIELALQNTSNRDETAQALGISRSTLWRKLKKYKL